MDRTAEGLVTGFSESCIPSGPSTFISARGNTSEKGSRRGVMCLANASLNFASVVSNKKFDLDESKFLLRSCPVAESRSKLRGGRPFLSVFVTFLPATVILFPDIVTSDFVNFCS